MQMIKYLEQVDEDLGEYALQKLKSNGVEFIMNTQVKGATRQLRNWIMVILFHTIHIIWTSRCNP